jgi:hypothetical protein
MTVQQQLQATAKQRSTEKKIPVAQISLDDGNDNQIMSSSAGAGGLGPSGGDLPIEKTKVMMSDRLMGLKSKVYDKGNK